METEQKIKGMLEEFGDFVLKNAGDLRDYDKFDMSNATLIFQEVVMALAYQKNMKKSEETQLKMAKDMGAQLRQYVLRWTDVDLHKVYSERNKEGDE